MAVMDAVIGRDDLATHLRNEAVSWPDLDAADVTVRIGVLIRQWALRNEGQLVAEWPIDVPGVDRRGHLDFVISWPGNRLALEVDRGNKRWSVRKLEAAVAGGLAGLPTVALWVRWRGQISGSVPASVRRIAIYQARYV